MTDFTALFPASFREAITLHPSTGSGDAGAERTFGADIAGTAIVLPSAMTGPTGALIEANVTHVAYVDGHYDEHSLPVGSEATFGGSRRRIMKVAPAPSFSSVGLGDITEIQLGGRG